MPEENKWVVLIYMAATSPELREIMERDLAEMASRLRIVESSCLRAYALMDTPDGRYAVRHALHRVPRVAAAAITPGMAPGASPVKPDPATKIHRLKPDLAKVLGAKGAFLADFIHWRFGGGGDADPGPVEHNRTLLILWGHSQGVAAALSRPGSPAYAMVGNGGFGLDHLSGDSLSLPEIRRSIARGLEKTFVDDTKKWQEDSREGTPPLHSIDILSFDSCFMSAAEVSAEFQREAPTLPDDDTPFEVNLSADELKGTPAQVAARRAAVEDHIKKKQKERKDAQEDENKAARVDYVIASQTAVLLDGLDYGRIVDAFIDADPPANVAPEELGRRLLEQACSGDRSPVSLSLINTRDTDGYKRFAEAFEALVARLGKILDTGTTRPPHHVFAERLRQEPVCEKGQFLANEGASRSEWLRIRDAFEGATWHQVRQFVDVGDLCRRLRNNSRDPDLRCAALRVIKTLEPPNDPSVPAPPAPAPAQTPASGTARAGTGQRQTARGGAAQTEVASAGTAQSAPPQKPQTPLIVDVRSEHPLVFSGLSLYCPWLFPTPEEARKGAWNAVVDLFDYSRGLWFNRREHSWGAFLYHAKHILEESRQRAINTEIADLRAAARRCSHERYGEASLADGSPLSERSPRKDKPGGHGFEIAEPAEAQTSAPVPSLFKLSSRIHPEDAVIAAARRLDSTAHVPISPRLPQD